MSCFSGCYYPESRCSGRDGEKERVSQRAKERKRCSRRRSLTHRQQLLMNHSCQLMEHKHMRSYNTLIVRCTCDSSGCLPPRKNSKIHLFISKLTRKSFVIFNSKHVTWTGRTFSVKILTAPSWGVHVGMSSTHVQSHGTAGTGVESNQVIIYAYQLHLFNRSLIQTSNQTRSRQTCWRCSVEKSSLHLRFRPSFLAKPVTLQSLRPSLSYSGPKLQVGLLLCSIFMV